MAANGRYNFSVSWKITIGVTFAKSDCPKIRLILFDFS